MPAKTLTLNEPLEIFHNIKSAKNKMLEADPNRERNRTGYHGIETMSTPYE